MRTRFILTSTTPKPSCIYQYKYPIHSIASIITSSFHFSPSLLLFPLSRNQWRLPTLSIGVSSVVWHGPPMISRSARPSPNSAKSSNRRSVVAEIGSDPIHSDLLTLLLLLLLSPLLLLLLFLLLFYPGTVRSIFLSLSIELKIG